MLRGQQPWILRGDCSGYHLLAVYIGCQLQPYHQPSQTIRRMHQVSSVLVSHDQGLRIMLRTENTAGRKSCMPCGRTLDRPELLRHSMYFAQEWDRIHLPFDAQHGAMTMCA